MIDGGLAASEAGDRLIRELDRAYLKRPGRGVPPPRSGPPPVVVVLDTDQRHALPELPVYVSENSGRTWGAP